MHTILVVDDEPILRKRIVKTIRDAGHTVIEAASGLEALGLMEGRSVDLVLTDIFMPDCDGIEFISRIGKTPKPPIIIAMSADPASFKVLRMAAHLGATATLPKPFSKGELMDLVASMLSRQTIAS